VRVVLLILCCGTLLLPLLAPILIYIFRLSCSLCGLPKPQVLVASGIILVNLLVDVFALMLLEEAVWVGAQELGLPRWESWIVTRFLDLPVDLVISAGLHAKLMGIPFGKGIEVWFVQRLIQLSIVTVITFIGVVIYFIQAN